MIVSVSGTPGTGKSAVSKILARKLNANLISISSLKIRYAWDGERKTKVIAIEDVQKAVDRRLARSKTNIVDGHLSHLLKADVVVVLRCEPPALERRMKKKGWNISKIRENLQAEILDEITIEAVEKHGKTRVFEIDATRRSPAEISAIIAKLLNNRDTKRYRAGKIDWSERYKELLIRRLS